MEGLGVFLCAFKGAKLFLEFFYFGRFPKSHKIVPTHHIEGMGISERIYTYTPDPRCRQPGARGGGSGATGAPSLCPTPRAQDGAFLILVVL